MEGHHNYLYENSTTLDQHIISTPGEQTKRKIVMLGNSSIKGSNIPPGNNVSDNLNKRLKNFKSYNIGVFKGSTTELLAIFRLSLKYKPEYLVIGVNPDLFSEVPTGDVVWHYYRSLKEYLDPDLFKRIEEQERKKMDLMSLYRRGKKVAYPPDTVIAWRSWLLELRNKIYGPTMDVNVWGNHGAALYKLHKEGKESYDVFKTIIRMARENDVKVIAYLDPIYKTDVTYNMDEFSNYKNEIIRYLNAEGIHWFDYTDVLPDKSEYFKDFIHLNPGGYTRIAEILYQDIKGVIGD